MSKGTNKLSHQSSVVNMPESHHMEGLVDRHEAKCDIAGWSPRLRED